MSMLPVTKMQFETFLSQPGGLSSTWYQRILDLNPRVSAVDFANDKREGLFATGVTFEEATQFAAWADSTGRLPRQNEWQSFAQRLRSKPFTREVAAVLARCGLSTKASNLLGRLVKLVKPTTMADLCLIRNGVFEWVHANPEPGGLGAPRDVFFPNTFDPYSDPPLKHFEQERSRIYGFRYLIDREKI